MPFINHIYINVQYRVYPQMKIPMQNGLVVKKPYIFKSTPTGEGRKVVRRPATPMFCWPWSCQTLAFILDRNRWLNMTGRKWESEAGDASRYCQITERMRQISLFLHLVLVISLASFSSLILLVWRYVVVGVLINLALTVKGSELPQTAMSPQTVLAWIQMNLRMDNRLFANAVLHFSPWNTYNYRMNSQLLWDLLL